MHIGLGIDCRIGRYAHSEFFGLGDMMRDFPERSRSPGNGVVGGFHPIEMDVPGQEGAAGKSLQPLGHQQAVCAKIDRTVQVNKSLDQVIEVAVEQGFATTYADNRGAAFLGSLEALFYTHRAIAEGSIFPDPSTPLAPEIASKQGLQH